MLNKCNNVIKCKQTVLYTYLRATLYFVFFYCQLVFLSYTLSPGVTQGLGGKQDTQIWPFEKFDKGTIYQGDCRGNAGP